MRRRGEDSDAGSATVWTVAAIACLMAVTVGALGLGSAVIARHQAESAADLAALAGAGRAVLGNEAACQAAAAITDSMGVGLESCRLQGWDVLVEVTARADLLPARLAAVTARARAGPIE